MLRLPSLTCLLVTALLLCACAPNPPGLTTPSITAAPSPVALTSTPEPDPTASVPLPSPTSPPPYLGQLTAEQREALDLAARAYISLNPQDALATAIELNFIGRNANPATMCGPLSIAILQQVGLVDQSVSLVDFWYLDPRPGKDEAMLKKVFPTERFEKIEQPMAVNEVDFTSNPLYPGDFLYLFAGDSGSFEHMLVVSRVDAEGRAFAVTNLNTPEGVIIAEVMLYDPLLPGSGQFYEWTDWENRYIGRTGYGGYWLWRPLATTP